MLKRIERSLKNKVLFGLTEQRDYIKLTNRDWFGKRTVCAFDKVIARVEKMHYDAKASDFDREFPHVSDGDEDEAVTLVRAVAGLEESRGYDFEELLNKFDLKGLVLDALQDEIDHVEATWVAHDGGLTEAGVDRIGVFKDVYDYVYSVMPHDATPWEYLRQFPSVDSDGDLIADQDTADAHFIVAKAVGLVRGEPNYLFWEEA